MKRKWLQITELGMPLAGVSNNVVKLKALLVVSILINFFEGGLLCVEN
jgi:hypothetical protein